LPWFEDTANGCSEIAFNDKWKRYGVSRSVRVGFAKPDGSRRAAYIEEQNRTARAVSLPLQNKTGQLAPCRLHYRTKPDSLRRAAYIEDQRRA